MREQKGITIVALVVTIIVLIILAGVTISLVIGDNGIIRKATEAAEKQKIKSMLEEIEMDISEEEIRASSGQDTFLYENIWNKLRQKDSNLQVTEDIDEESYEIKYKGYEFVIDKNKNVDIDTTEDIETQKYTIIYNSNGGTGTMVNSKATVKNNSFLGEEGQNFKNWNTSPDGKGNVYNPGDKITSEPNSEVTLYAQWEFDSIANYTLWFDGTDRCTEVSGGWVGGKSQGSGIVTDNLEYVTFEDNSTNETWSYLNYVAQKQLTEEDCTDTIYLIIYETISQFDEGKSGLDFDIKKDNTATYNNNWSSTASGFLKERNSGKMKIEYGVIAQEAIGNYICVRLTDRSTLTPKANLYNVSLAYKDNWEKLRELAGLSAEVYNSEKKLMDNNALQAIFENDNAYNYLINRCTGTFMVRFLGSDTAIEFLNNKKQENPTRYNELRNNENWNKFLTMLEQ